MSKNRVEVLKNIKSPKFINVVTYQSEFNFASFTRDYYLYDENNNLCAKADSKWCIIDSNTGKIVPTKEVLFLDITLKPKAFESKNNKIRFIFHSLITLKNRHTFMHIALYHNYI